MVVLAVDEDDDPSDGERIVSTLLGICCWEWSMSRLGSDIGDDVRVGRGTNGSMMVHAHGRHLKMG